MIGRALGASTGCDHGGCDPRCDPPCNPDLITVPCLGRCADLVDCRYAQGYPKMGMALQASGRDIVYSCSWPAYLGGNETSKPFDAMIAAGCTLSLFLFIYFRTQCVAVSNHISFSMR